MLVMLHPSKIENSSSQQEKLCISNKNEMTNFYPFLVQIIMQGAKFEFCQQQLDSKQGSLLRHLTLYGVWRGFEVSKILQYDHVLKTAMLLSSAQTPNWMKLRKQHYIDVISHSLNSRLEFQLPHMKYSNLQIMTTMLFTSYYANSSQKVGGPTTIPDFVHITSVASIYSH